MLIGIDASRANRREKTGVEQYGYHVIRELAKIDSVNQYRLYTEEPLGPGLDNLPKNFESVVLPPRRFWSYTALSSELRKNPVDRLFIPSHIVPLVHPQHTVVTIHDLGFRHFRKSYSFYHYLNLHIGTWLSAKWAETIIVPSRAVATDVQEHYGVSSAKLAVIPNGYDPKMFDGLTATKVAEVMQHHNVTDPYLLYLGRLEVRKNVERLIEAFYRLRDSGLFGGQLVLVGNPGIGFDKIRSLIGKRPGYVVHTGYLSDPERAALLRGARLLAFPSLYEGFGIPILEAFAAGTPVLTADRGATAEIAGNAALLVDPEDTEAIHKGLERLLAEPELVKSLVNKGAERCQQYSWQKTAGQIHEVLTR